MLNELFSLCVVTDKTHGSGESPIDRALRMARAKGWNQTRFAAELQVLPQDITNWKKRGLPSDKYVSVASALGCSVDELVGRGRPNPPKNPASRWPFDNIPYEEFDQLGREHKTEIAEILEDRIRRLTQKPIEAKTSRKSLRR